LTWSHGHGAPLLGRAQGLALLLTGRRVPEDAFSGAGQSAFSRATLRPGDGKHGLMTIPRALLFDCMTRPEHLTHFWGPDGTTTPIDGITVEPQPGGRFETVMVNDADGRTLAGLS
jgi:Activator of Hsp90 ATPase homolog 1-like protein